MSRLRVSLSAAVCLGLIALGAATFPALAQQEASRYFPETGHTVRGPFLQFFDQRGGLEIFGYPITDEFRDPATGMLMQYFQRARMEWHPANPGPYKVLLGLLGSELGHDQPPLPPEEIPAPTNPDCAYFPQTGHAVCYSFLEFFNKKGRVDIFGYPVGEIMLENGRIVQYFQRARLEWYPERRPGQRVQLGLLGVVRFENAGLDQALLNAQRSDLPRQVTALQVRASVEAPITAPTGVQTVYVYVADQQGQPLAGAEVSLFVQVQAGAQTYQLVATDERGLTKIAFDFGRATPGQPVNLSVEAAYGTIKRGTRTSFLPWW